MTPPPRVALWLGYGGLLPFVGLAGASLWTGPTARPFFAFALVAYGSSILSFLGAIHWGLAMRNPNASQTGFLLWGVLPSLAAWLALMAGTALGLWVVVAGLWVCFAVDRQMYPKFELHRWLPMRLVLTTVATLSCASVAWSLRQAVS